MTHGVATIVISRCILKGYCKCVSDYVATTINDCHIYTAKYIVLPLLAPDVDRLALPVISTKTFFVWSRDSYIAIV